MSVRKSVLRIWAKYQLKSFRKKCRHPQKEYKKTWKKIRSINTEAEVKAVKKLTDLRKLPITDYSNYRDVFRKTLSGQVNPLNKEKIHFWATSTGSSGSSKLFPISKSVDESHKNAAKWRVAMLINRYEIYTGAPELIFVMPGEVMPFAPGRPIGQIGYYHYRNAMPNWLEEKFTFTKELYKRKQEFNDWHVLLSILQDCTGISTSIPSRVTLFLNQINAQREEILSCLKNETWPKDLALKTSQSRLDFAIKALQKPISHPQEIWPSFKFLCVWKAGETCGRQLKELTLRYDFSQIEIIDQFYNASEGLFNIPFPDGKEGGPANVFGIILEFYHQESATYYWPWELKKGERYELVLTNAMGLTRYNTYDIVECTGYYENVPNIKFHSRVFPEISLGWCTISETQLAEALKQTGFVRFSDIFFTINEEGNGLSLVSHDIENKERADLLEKSLKSINENYALQQKSGNIVALDFNLISLEKFNSKMLENPNNKRLLLS